MKSGKEANALPLCATALLELRAPAEELVELVALGDDALPPRDDMLGMVAFATPVLATPAALEVKDAIAAEPDAKAELAATLAALMTADTELAACEA